MGGIAALSISISGQGTSKWGSSLKLRQLEALKKNTEEKLQNKEIRAIDESKLNEKINRVKTEIEKLENKEKTAEKKPENELTESEKKRRFDSLECSACDSRRYQDGSNDSGVSFQNPTKINPSAAEGAVRAHENEHVVRNKAEAEREDRKVISSTVTINHATCSECGKTYVAGGVTRTTTVADNSKNNSANNVIAVDNDNKYDNENYLNRDSIFTNKFSKEFAIGMFDDTNINGNELDIVA
mgnify:CR=1 FL=1